MKELSHSGGVEFWFSVFGDYKAAIRTGLYKQNRKSTTTAKIDYGTFGFGLKNKLAELSVSRIFDADKSSVINGTTKLAVLINL